MVETLGCISFFLSSGERLLCTEIHYILRINARLPLFFVIASDWFCIIVDNGLWKFVGFAVTSSLTWRTTSPTSNLQTTPFCFWISVFLWLLLCGYSYFFILSLSLVSELTTACLGLMWSIVIKTAILLIGSYDPTILVSQ